jgi:hypothetical protein
MANLSFKLIGMKKVVILFLLFPLLLDAQVSFPNSATSPIWRVKQGNFFGTLRTGDYLLGNEVTLENKQYREIISIFPPDYIPSIDGYVRNEGKKVYIVTIDFLSNGLSKEKLMYDFSLEVNKKIYCAALSLENPTDSTLCWAGSTDSMVYRGTKRKIWNLLYAERSGFPNDTLKVPVMWVEGIGTLTHPFFPLHCISGGCESISSLICLQESNGLKYLNPLYSSCETLITDTKDLILGEEIKFYPNLASHQLTVESKSLNNLNIQISNSLGQLFITQQLVLGTNMIDISNLASGIYFATISSGQKKRTEKFVKN